MCLSYSPCRPEPVELEHGRVLRTFCTSSPSSLQVGRRDLLARLDSALCGTASVLLSLSGLFFYCTMKVITPTWKGYLRSRVQGTRHLACAPRSKAMT